MRCFGTYKGKLKKGLGLILLIIVAACSVLFNVRQVQAASASVTEDTVTAYNNHMASVGINNGNDYGEYRVRDRAHALMRFNNNNGYVLSADGRSLNFYSDPDKAIFKDWKRGVTSAPSGQNLYMMEFASNQDASPYYDCSFAIVYEQDGYVHWTSIKDLDDEATEFLDHEQFEVGRREQVTFSLPSYVDRILGVYIENDSGGGDNDDPWGISYLNIYEAYNVGEVEEDIYGKNFRAFQGELLAGVSQEDIDNNYLGNKRADQEINNGWLYCLMTPGVEDSHYTDSQYLVEVVTGDTDYQGSSVDVNVKYKDAFGVSHTVKTSMNEQFWEKLQPSSTVSKIYGAPYNQYGFGYFNHTNYDFYKPYYWVGGDSRDFEYDSYALTSWDNATATEMNFKAAGLLGNYVNYFDFGSNFLSAYSETDIPIMLPGIVGEVESISLEIPSENKELRIQGLRLIDARVDLSKTYFNGCYSSQRIFDYEGTLLAYFQGNVLLNSNNPTRVFEPNGISEFNDLKLVREKIDNRNSEEELGINIRLADVSGAGIETFAAADYTYYFDPTESEKGVFDNWTEEEQLFYMHERDYLLSLHKFIKFLGYNQNAMAQLFNLMHGYWKEPLTLKVIYRDTLGARRVVEVPFMTAYVMELFTDNKSAFETASNTEWLGGIFQQGQELGLRLNLSQYQYLESLELVYDGSREGTIPKGFIAAEITANKVLGGTDSKTKNHELDTGADTISVRAVEVYENVSKPYFYNQYDKSINGLKLVKTGRVGRLEHYERTNMWGGKINDTIIKYEEKSAEASYHFLSEKRNGYTMSTGGHLSLSTAEKGNLKQGAAPDRNEDYKGTYLVRIVPTTGEADTQLRYKLGYTTTSGEEKETSLILISQAIKDFYGITGRRTGIPGESTKKLSDASPTQYGEEYQFMSHALGDEGTSFASETRKSPTTLCFLVELDDVSTIDSIYFSFNGKGKWQAQSVQVWKLDTLSARYCSGRKVTTSTLLNINSTMPLGGFLWERDYTGTVVSKANRPVLFTKNNPTGTIYFSVLQPDGKTYADPVKTEEPSEYLEGRPESMTYEETLKDLGLAVPKRSYQVDVKVADVEDAGSNNYFYFQLVFENGNSGLVLANQQLTSDSFRRGVNETFTIKTTQNYGALKAVRVICDVTSSDSQAFDKLNIEKITVSQTTAGGIGKSYVVERVGWVDINYRDEGESEVINAEAKMNLSNIEIIREYAVTKMSSNATLLFCLSSGGNVATSYSTLGGAFDAVLTYTDGNGFEQTYSFDLLKQIYEYNESEERVRLFRTNHTDRFVLTMTDISSVKQLKITRRNGTENSVWTGKAVSVSQVGELGRVFISVASDEYLRDTALDTPLTSSSNQNISIGASNYGTFSFEENKILLDTSDEDSGWSAQITRYPTGNTENLNIYLYAGEGYEFSENTPKLNGSVRYTSKFGGTTQQTPFTLEKIGNVQGATVLYANGIQTGAMSNLQKMFLESSTTAGTQPTIKAARVERVQNGVIKETLYFDFGNKNLESGKIDATAQTAYANSNMKQIVRLQPVEDTNVIFQPETNDIAVALRYTSELDPKATKTVYLSPYVFLTDAGINSIYGGRPVEIPFNVDGIGEVVGLKIISSGATVNAENAIIYNYGENANGEQGTFLGSCQLPDSFAMSTVVSSLTKKAGTNVVPVTFTFTTPKETEMPGAGTSGKVEMEINYVDLNGNEQTKTLKNMLQYLPDNQQPTAGTEVSFELLMSNLSYIKSIRLMPDSDDWYLTGIKAAAKKIDGLYTTVVTGASSVGKWAKPTDPLTIELNVESSITTGAYDGIISGLELQGSSSGSGDSNTVKVGETFTLDVNPGDIVTLNATLTATAGANASLKWEPNGYMTLNDAKTTATIQISANAKIGSKITTAVYCEQNSTYRIPVELNVTMPEPKITDFVLNGSARQPGETSRRTAEAGNRGTLTLEVYPGDYVYLTPDITGTSGVDKSVTWETEGIHQIKIKDSRLNTNIVPTEFQVDVAADAVVGTQASLTVSSNADSNYKIDVVLKVVSKPQTVGVTVTMEQVDASGKSLSTPKTYPISSSGDTERKTFYNDPWFGKGFFDDPNPENYIMHTSDDPIYIRVTATVTNGTATGPLYCSGNVTSSNLVGGNGSTELSGVFELENRQDTGTRSCYLTCKSSAGVTTYVTVNFIEEW